MSDTLSHSPALATFSPQRGAARGSAADLDGQKLLLVRRRLAAVSGGGSPAEIAERLAGILGELKVWDCLAMVVLSSDGASATLEGLAAPTAGLKPELQAQLAAVGQQAICERKTSILRSQSPAGWIVAAPCGVSSQATQRALVTLSTQAVALNPPSLLLLEGAAAEYAAAEVQQQLADSERDLAHTAGVVELVERLSGCRSLIEISQRLAGELAAMFTNCQVCVGRRVRAGVPVRIEAQAGGTISTTVEVSAAFAAVLEETLFRRRLCVWPAESPQDEAGLLMHRQYATEHSGAWLVSVSLVAAGVEELALLVVGTDALQRVTTARFLAAASAPIATVVGTLQRAQRGPGQRLYHRIRRAAAERRVWAWSAVAALSVLALAAPVPHRIECDCAIEPVVRQFVAAPFGAPLEASLVRPGDEVTSGQLLARLDGREVRWELAGVEADLQRAARERDGHMAQHDSGAARLSELQMERLQLQRTLLEHRSEQLEIRSPLGGLVISGDLDQAIGAPLKIGQVMFELAPLDRVVVELKIPERDVPFALVGQPVRFWLESQPDEPRVGSIARITPRGEIIDGASVFVAEMPFDNHAAWLRPGMRGTARIDVGECRLGWRLFHRAWEAARIWFGV